MTGFPGMKVLLCDIGGVLLKVDFSTALDKVGRRTGIGRQDLHDRIFLSGVKDRHDSGTVGSHDFYRHIIPNGEITFQDFQAAWGDIFTENREMVASVLGLSKKCRLYIASNTDPIHYEYFVSRYAWFSAFQGSGMSFRLGSLKPSPEFFTKLCRQFDIRYSDALFVDDMPENVDAANSLGIRSHVYSGVDGFRRFVENGLIR